MALSRVVAPVSNRLYLFNYFAKPPLDESSFVANWRQVADYLLDKDHFISTHLHNSSSPNTKFPWVNFAVFDSDDICVFGKPDPKWREFLEQGDRDGLKPLPGQYLEIASFKGNSLTDGNKERPSEYRFLLTGVAPDDSVSSEDLEANWASWTGTSFVQEHLKDNPCLGDSLLYKLNKGRNPMIRYTVRTELTKMDDVEGHALAEMVDKQPRPKGIQTYTGFYRIHTDLFYKKAE